MALPSTIYRAGIELADLDRGLYESLQTTIARHPSETAERLVVRLLAYALCYQEGLVFTKGVGAGDEPDLWFIGPDGRVVTWIEVGLPEPERIVKASRHCEKTILVVSGAASVRWVDQHLAKLNSCRNVAVLSLDHAFVVKLSAGLERNISWSLTVTEGSLYLGTNGDTLESRVTLLAGIL